VSIGYELPWTGRPFLGVPFLSFDTETAVKDRDGAEYDLSRVVPPIVLATVSDGTRHAVLRPDQLPEFIRQHSDVLLVGHNIAFDYWVVWKEIHRWMGVGLWEQWERLPDAGLMDDTMLLDFLVRIADPNAAATDGMRNLDQVARLVGMGADKQSPYRLRFHELLGQDWSKADQGFFQYAVEDTHVTWHVYQHLREKAAALAHRAGISAEQYDRHGPLTSRLQTRASIVMAQIGRNGMGIDQSKVDGVRDELRKKVDGLVGNLMRYDPPLFSYYVRNPRTGERKVNRKTQVPNLNYTSLRVHLKQAAEEVGYDVRDLPKTPKGETATRLDDWRRIAPDAPIVQTWSELADTAKVLQFVAQVDGKGSVHPGYRTCVRTGRASCVQPNIMQMPKERWFRQMFVPRSGHKYVIVDYSAIELRTLAAVLLDLYKQSKLAEVLRTGICPHTYTASMVTGWSYEEVKAGVKAEKGLPEPGKYSKARQAAKAINFGVPGGLGAKRLCAYARINYGVEMEEDQARSLRDSLVYDVYPELAQYLSYDVFAVLAQNMHCDRDELQWALERGDITSWHVERTLRRGGKTDDGRDINLPTQSHIWDVLEKHNQNPTLLPAIWNWKGDTRGLCGETVKTLTGRIRAGVDYGEARNTRFQGLAADGAKIALWRLHQAGFRIVGFIHDEIVVEVPDDGKGNAEDKDAIERTMKESMASVLQCDIPVEVEGVVAESWVK